MWMRSLLSKKVCTKNVQKVQGTTFLGPRNHWSHICKRGEGGKTVGVRRHTDEGAQTT